MQTEYLGLVVLLIVAAIVCSAFVALGWFFGPKKSTPYKMSAYECGVEPVGDVHIRFPIKFYLVGILFILFDIEVVFLWSWMSVYKTADLAFKQFSFIEFITYMSSWVLGFLYVIKVGALDWDEATTLEHAKLAPVSTIEAGPIDTRRLSA